MVPNKIKLFWVVAIFFFIGVVFFLLYNSFPVSHVIIISMDTTRADHFGCYGHPWIKTPSIDSLEKDSVLFENFVTVASTTLASHTSLFTGKYPITHGTPNNKSIVNNLNIMLPEILRSKGFTTIGIIGGMPLSDRFNFAQGFNYYDENLNPENSDDRILRSRRNAKKVTDSVIQCLDKKKLPKHLFMFVHYFDPHNPYQPISPYNSMYKNKYLKKKLKNKVSSKVLTRKNLNKARRYAGEISYMDKHVGRLLVYLKSRGILDKSILILTSDHGENLFWDPNPFSHGWDTYQGVLRAFCMIRLPETIKKGRKIYKLIANIDILPTLLKYLKISAPKGIDGKAFNLTGEDIGIGDRILFAEASKPTAWQDHRKWTNINNSRCIYKGPFKYIYTPYLKTEEFYNLTIDPLERNNLIYSNIPGITTKIKEMKRILNNFIYRTRPMKPRFIRKEKKTTLEQLKTLGYL